MEEAISEVSVLGKCSSNNKRNIVQRNEGLRLIIEEAESLVQGVDHLRTINVKFMSVYANTPPSCRYE